MELFFKATSPEIAQQLKSKVEKYKVLKAVA
jgi:hypothetical protein